MIVDFLPWVKRLPSASALSNGQIKELHHGQSKMDKSNHKWIPMGKIPYIPIHPYIFNHPTSLYIPIHPSWSAVWRVDSGARQLRSSGQPSDGWQAGRLLSTKQWLSGSMLVFADVIIRAHRVVSRKVAQFVLKSASHNGYTFTMFKPFGSWRKYPGSKSTVQSLIHINYTSSMDSISFSEYSQSTSQTTILLIIISSEQIHNPTMNQLWTKAILSFWDSAGTHPEFTTLHPSPSPGTGTISTVRFGSWSASARDVPSPPSHWAKSLRGTGCGSAWYSYMHLVLSVCAVYTDVYCIICIYIYISTRPQTRQGLRSKVNSLVLVPCLVYWRPKLT